MTNRLSRFATAGCRIYTLSSVRSSVILSDPPPVILNAVSEANGMRDLGRSCNH